MILNECHSCESDIPVDKGSGMRGFQNVAITSYTPDKIVLHTILHTSGFLVFSELWYPGWKAYDNGKEVPIYKADLLFRAVALTKGNHIIIFSYEPASIKIGEIISGITIFLIIGYILLYNRHLWQRKN